MIIQTFITLFYSTIQLLSNESYFNHDIM